MNILGVAPTSTHTATVGLTVYAGVAGAATLTQPPNGTVGASRTPTFEWTAGTGMGTYHLQVATDAAFTNIVVDEAGITTTSFVSPVTLNTSTTYYWRVMTENTCGSAVSATFTFLTMAGPGDCNTGQVQYDVFFDNMEAGVGLWTHSAAAGTDSWAQSTIRSMSPTHSWFGVDPSSVADQRLVSPPIVLPTGRNPLALKFWQWYEMEESTTTACWDGGILEVSADGGTTWTQMVSEILVHPYDHAVNTSGNPLSGLQAWCSDSPSQDWVETIVDLGAFAGETIQLRYRLGSDSSVGGEGWYIDDVRVQQCVPDEPDFLVHLPVVFSNAANP
jgi:hypothetical protein